MLVDSSAFGAVDEGTVGTRGDQIGRGFAKLGINLVERSGGVAAVKEVCATGDFLDTNGKLGSTFL